MNSQMSEGLSPKGRMLGEGIMKTGGVSDYIQEKKIYPQFNTVGENMEMFENGSKASGQSNTLKWT